MIEFRQTKIHNIGATLVGVDKVGNKYYEKLHQTQYGDFLLNLKETSPWFQLFYQIIYLITFYLWIKKKKQTVWVMFVGRHRWVEYASKDRYNASQVPPEWHGWLHFITDHTGDEVTPPPAYLLHHHVLCTMYYVLCSILLL